MQIVSIQTVQTPQGAVTPKPVHYVVIATTSCELFQAHSFVYFSRKLKTIKNLNFFFPPRSTKKKKKIQIQIHAHTATILQCDQLPHTLDGGEHQRELNMLRQLFAAASPPRSLPTRSRRDVTQCTDQPFGNRERPAAFLGRRVAPATINLSAAASITVR